MLRILECTYLLRATHVSSPMLPSREGGVGSGTLASSRLTLTMNGRYSTNGRFMKCTKQLFTFSVALRCAMRCTVIHLKKKMS